MICEFCNWITIQIANLSNNEDYQPEPEFTLEQAIITILLGLLILISIVWWLIPLRIISRPLSKIKFTCKRKIS